MAVTFQLGIDDTSPTITYSPSSENSTSSGSLAGWIPSYSLSSSQASGQLGNGTSFHVTSVDAATLSLTWSGTGVELYGKVAEASYTAILDGSSMDDMVNLASSDPEMLVGFQNLPDGQHTVTLTVHTQSNSSSFVAFDRAVITASVNANNATVSTQIVDDSTISFQGQWSFERDLFPNLGFHITNKTGDNAHLTFTGAAVTVSGLRDFTFGRYNVTLDGETAELDAQSFWREETTLFFKTGLDPNSPHTMIITNAENRSLAIGAINVTSISSTPMSSDGGYPKGTIAGLVVGIVMGVTILAVLAFLLWRRRRRRDRLIFIEPSIHKMQKAEDRIIEIRDDDDDDKIFPTRGGSSRSSLDFAPNPALLFRTHVKPAPLNLPQSPTGSSPSSPTQQLQDIARGSALRHTEPVDLDSYLSINIRSPHQVDFEAVSRPEVRDSSSERRNSAVERRKSKPIGPRERPSQDSARTSRAFSDAMLPMQPLPVVHITPSTAKPKTTDPMSFLELHSTPSSSLRQPSRDSQQSQSVAHQHSHSQSRSQSRLSNTSSTPSQNPKRISEQTRSSMSGGPISLSALLQEQNIKPERQTSGHPYSNPTSPIFIPSRRNTQEISPTESLPLTMSDIQFREMSVSDHDVSRRGSDSHRWQLPLPQVSPTIVHKLFGLKQAQSIEQRNLGNHLSSSASVLQPRLVPNR